MVVEAVLEDKLPISAKGSRARGQIRAREILQTALEVLANEGYRSLTLRRIAKKMGISTGNVTYYYSTKERLLEAIISDHLARYDREFELEAVNFPDHPVARIRAYFEFLVEDARDPASQRFFYQLWALSSHNAGAAIQREAVYEHFLHQVCTHLTAVRPELTEGEINKRGFLLMSLVEGMNVIYGSGDRLNAKFDTPGPWVLDQIMKVVLN